MAGRFRFPHTPTHTHTHTHTLRLGYLISVDLSSFPFFNSLCCLVSRSSRVRLFLFFLGLSVSADRFFFFFFFFFFKKSRFYLVLPSLVGFLFELIKNRLFVCFFCKFSLIVDFEWTVDWFEQVLPSFAEIDFEPVFASSFRGWMKKKNENWLVLPSFTEFYCGTPGSTCFFLNFDPVLAGCWKSTISRSFT